MAKSERELLVEYKLALERRDDIKSALADAQAVYDKAETAMVEFLIAKEANETATYDGVGYAKMMKPRVFASCKIENIPALKSHLINTGRHDLINETIAPAALSSYVGEVIDAGKAPPDMVSYYLKQTVRMY